jgi:uncharacterized protein YukE
MNILLVGGGNASIIILNYFAKIHDVSVSGVIDLRADAPGIVLARKMGIETGSDMERMLARHDINIVIELTGVKAVRDKISGLLKDGQELLTAGAAKILVDIISNEFLSVAQDCTSQFETLNVRLQEAIKNINEAYKYGERVLRESRLIATNGRIEAARAGDTGRTFSVVIDRVNEMLCEIQKILDNVSKASVECNKTLDEMNSTSDKLKESLHAA